MHVAALDLLRELDLLRGGQERVPAGLAQEELQRVGRRLDRLDGRRGRRRRGLGLLLRLLRQQLDAAPVELDVHGFDLERVELHRLEQLDQLLLAQLAARLGRFEQRRKLLVDEDRLDLDGQLRPPGSEICPGQTFRTFNQPKHFSQS